MKESDYAGWELPPSLKKVSTDVVDPSEARIAGWVNTPFPPARYPGSLRLLRPICEMGPGLAYDTSTKLASSRERHPPETNPQQLMGLRYATFGASKALHGNL